MKKFLGIICFLYSVIILYVWLSGNLDNYIAPNMQMYIKGSVLPLIVIGGVLLLNDKISYKFKISDLILILPLVLIVLAGDGKLSIDIAKVKATTKNRTKSDIVDPVDYDKQEKIEDFYFEIEDSNYSYLADYLTFMSGGKKYAGKTIKFVGFAVDYTYFLTDEYSAIGRYMITCCAADAEFTGFMTKIPKDEIEYGKWYEVEGYLVLGKDNEGYDIITVDPVSVKEIDGKKLNQNVYSCDSYGKDACKSLQKYDLEY